MGHLLPALSEEKFTTEREVVLNERRQNYENRPYGLSSVALAAALFPPEHPYSWVTIGAPADLAGLERRRRAPVLPHVLPPVQCLARDCRRRRHRRDAGARRALLRRHGGRAGRDAAAAHGHPGGAGLARARGPRGAAASLARLAHAGHVPRRRRRDGHRRRRAVERQDVPPLSHARLRHPAGGRRLGDPGLARDVERVPRVGHRRAGPVARPTIATVIERTLDDIAATGPTADELERATARAEAQFVYRVQTIGGFGGKSDQLNAYNVFTGSPGFIHADRERYTRATARSVAEAVRRWLRDAPGVALSVVPRGQTTLGLPGASRCNRHERRRSHPAAGRRRGAAVPVSDHRAHGAGQRARRARRHPARRAGRVAHGARARRVIGRPRAIEPGWRRSRPTCSTTAPARSTAPASPMCWRASVPRPTSKSGPMPPS